MLEDAFAFLKNFLEFLGKDPAWISYVLTLYVRSLQFC